eukprot:8352004-Alexandrium_andersonii.AAC.1
MLMWYAFLQDGYTILAADIGQTFTHVLHCERCDAQTQDFHRQLGHGGKFLGSMRQDTCEFLGG